MEDTSLEPIKSNVSSMWAPKNLFKRQRTSKFTTNSTCEEISIIIYIKPFDDEVFENFIKIVKYLEDKEKERECGIKIIVAPDLHKTYEEQMPLQQAYGITKSLETF